MTRSLVQTLTISLGLVAACARSEEMPAPLSAPVLVPASAPASARVPAVAPATCAPRDLPPDFAEHGVARLPRDVWARAFGPVFAALCACATERAHVVVTVAPSVGEVRAVATDQPAVSACLATRLDPGRFAPFAVDGDCVDCGPHAVVPPDGSPRLGPPRAPAPAARGPSFVVPIDYAP